MLVDTSVWVAHLRLGHARLAALLRERTVLCHPFVIGELACGTLPRRREILGLLSTLPQAPVADHDEVLTLVEHAGLMGCGVGWVDMHLLCSTLLAHTVLWTLDQRLARAASVLGIEGAA